MKRCLSNTRGSTLILALWALILVSAVIFAWVQAIDGGIDAVNEANRGMEARAMAHSGLAVALHPEVASNSPHLKANVEGKRSYHVTIESEGGRLNLSYFLAGGDDKKLQFLKEYLALRGMEFQEREVFIDCLLDWVSPSGKVHRLNGVPETPDYQPPHRALQSLDEIALIHGSGPLISQAHWKDDLTLYSSGPLDIESASADLLSLVPGIGEQRAQRFVQIREKRKVESPTEDGRPFKNLAEALSYLGLTQQQFTDLSGFLGFRDNVLHIHSEGKSGEIKRQVDVVVRKTQGASGQILLWSED